MIYQNDRLDKTDIFFGFFVASSHVSLSKYNTHCLVPQHRFQVELFVVLCHAKTRDAFTWHCKPFLNAQHRNDLNLQCRHRELRLWSGGRTKILSPHVIPVENTALGESIVFATQRTVLETRSWSRCTAREMMFRGLFIFWILVQLRYTVD